MNNNACWLEMEFSEAVKLRRRVVIKVPLGIKGALWMLLATAVEKLLEIRAWIIATEDRITVNLPVRQGGTGFKCQFRMRGLSGGGSREPEKEGEGK